MNPNPQKTQRESSCVTQSIPMNPNPSDSDEGLSVFPPDNKFPPGLICPFCGRNHTKKSSDPRVRCRRCDAHLGMVATLQRWREKHWRQQCTCGQRPTIEVMLSRATYKCKHCPSKWSVDSNLVRWEGGKQHSRRRRGKAKPPAASTTDDDGEQQSWQEEEQEVEEEDESVGVMEEPAMEKMHKEMAELRLENERLMEEVIRLRIENEIITENRNYLSYKLASNAEDIGRAINIIYSLRNTCNQE